MVAGHVPRGCLLHCAQWQTCSSLHIARVFPRCDKVFQPKLGVHAGKSGIYTFYHMVQSNRHDHLMTVAGKHRNHAAGTPAK